MYPVQRAHLTTQLTFTKFYNIPKELTPSYLKEPIPQPRMFLYGQRRENVLHGIPYRTSRFLNSFYPDTIRSWNNIGFEFRNCSTLSKLKSIFGVHGPYTYTHWVWQTFLASQWVPSCSIFLPIHVCNCICATLFSNLLLRPFPVLEVFGTCSTKHNFPLSFD